MRRPGYMEILRPMSIASPMGSGPSCTTRRNALCCPANARSIGSSTSGGAPPACLAWSSKGPGRTAMRAIFREDLRPNGVASYVQNHTVSEAEHPDGTIRILRRHRRVFLTRLAD